MISLRRRTPKTIESLRKQICSARRWMSSSSRGKPTASGKRDPDLGVDKQLLSNLVNKLPENLSGMFAEAQRCYILQDFNRVCFLLLVTTRQS